MGKRQGFGSFALGVEFAADQGDQVETNNQDNHISDAAIEDVIARNTMLHIPGKAGGRQQPENGRQKSARPHMDKTRASSAAPQSGLRTVVGTEIIEQA